MNKPTKKFKISIYLIKNNYTIDKDFISNIKSMRHFPISDKQGEYGDLYIRTQYSSVPVWADFFESVFDPKAINLENLSAKAVLVVNIKNRKFCLTFGHAHFLLDQLAIQRNFGLKVALNFGDEYAIKAVDKTNLNETGIQTKEQSNKDIGINGFGYDFETDILKSLTAKDDDRKQTFSGRDSFSVGASVTLENLRDYIIGIYDKYNSDAYKTKFSWVDNIYQERDREIIDQLDNELVKRISNNSKFISLSIPEVIPWEDISGFTYKQSQNPAVEFDISLARWKDVIVKNNNMDLRTLNNKKVNAYNINSTIYKSWTIYQCLNAEIDFNGNKYILNDRVWYCIDIDFVKKIKDFYDNIPNSTVNLPKYGTKKEPEYNKYVESINKGKIQSLDVKLTMVGGGKNRIEFCDLFTIDKQIIHVKKYGSSSVLSHLFQQGIVSGELFISLF